MNKSAGGAAVQIEHTICDICNPMTHCGIDAHIRDGKVVKVEGTAGNPHSMGRLCVKGAASRQYIYNSERLLTPLRRTGERGGGGFEAVSWDAALDLTGERLKDIAAKYGPESVAFFVGYPKWMRPFVKRLAHSFGSPQFPHRIQHLLNRGGPGSLAELRFFCRTGHTQHQMPPGMVGQSLLFQQPGGGKTHGGQAARP
jgi:anaerobic selenocysteine-containing dehydrogenase